MKIYLHYFLFLLVFLSFSCLFAQKTNVSVLLPDGRVLDKNAYYIREIVEADGDLRVAPVAFGGDALMGVNVFDLLLIQKHLLGVAPLTDPYKLIAADMNKSKSVTPSDIIELRKLILGIYSNGLPNVPSWVFIDKKIVFPSNPFNSTGNYVTQNPTPNDPYSDYTLPPFIIELQAGNNHDVDFWGIKTGDVTFNANPGDCTITKAAEERPVLSIKEAIEIDKSAIAIQAATEFSSTAWQFSFDLSKSGLKVQDVHFTFPINGVNAAWNVTATGELRVLWFTTDENSTPMYFEAGTSLFEIIFEAGSLKNEAFSGLQLKKESEIQNLIFDERQHINLVEMETATQERTSSESDAKKYHFSIAPNPSVTYPTIQIKSDQAFSGWIRVYNNAGAAVASWLLDIEAGEQTFQKSKMDRLSAGQYYICLETPNGILSRTWTKL